MEWLLVCLSWQVSDHLVAITELPRVRSPITGKTRTLLGQVRAVGRTALGITPPQHLRNSPPAHPPDPNQLCEALQHVFVS